MMRVAQGQWEALQARMPSSSGLPLMAREMEEDGRVFHSLREARP